VFELCTFLPQCNMDYDGDTLQVHLPATDKGIRDSHKMLLSRNTFGDRSRDHLLAKPEMEAVAGIHMALDAKGKGKHKVFNNQADALKAYRRGEIGINSNVILKK